MTCIRDIMDEEQLKREFDSIKQVFKGLSKEELPLRIEWGTRKAMELAATVVKSRPFRVECLDCATSKDFGNGDAPYGDVFYWLIDFLGKHGGHRIRVIRGCEADVPPKFEDFPEGASYLKIIAIRLGGVETELRKIRELKAWELSKTLKGFPSSTYR